MAGQYNAEVNKVPKLPIFRATFLWSMQMHLCHSCFLMPHTFVSRFILRLYPIFCTSTMNAVDYKKLNKLRLSNLMRTIWFSVSYSTFWLWLEFQEAAAEEQQRLWCAVHPPMLLIWFLMSFSIEIRHLLNALQYWNGNIFTNVINAYSLPGKIENKPYIIKNSSAPALKTLWRRQDLDRNKARMFDDCSGSGEKFILDSSCSLFFKRCGRLASAKVQLLCSIWE